MNQYDKRNLPKFFFLVQPSEVQKPETGQKIGPWTNRKFLWMNLCENTNLPALDFFSMGPAMFKWYHIASRRRKRDLAKKICKIKNMSRLQKQKSPLKQILGPFYWALRKAGSTHHYEKPSTRCGQVCFRLKSPSAPIISNRPRCEHSHLFSFCY